MAYGVYVDAAIGALMATDTDTNISDNILAQAQKTITDALASKGLSKIDRAVLETQNYFLMFLRDDHSKIKEMYPFYQSAKRREETAAKYFTVAITALIIEVIGLAFFYLR